MHAACADPKFRQRGFNFDGLLLFCFFLDEGRGYPDTTLSGPSWAHQRNAIKMAFHWGANDGSTTLNAGKWHNCKFSGDLDQYC